MIRGDCREFWEYVELVDIHTPALHESIPSLPVRDSTVQWRKLLLLHREVLQRTWCWIFPKHDFGTGRLQRYSTDAFERTVEAEAAKRPANPEVRRPTPRTTIEAILYCVRERGLKALKEPENIERLSQCDKAAREQIDRRIEKLISTKAIQNDTRATTIL